MIFLAALKAVAGDWRVWALLALLASYLFTYWWGWSSAHDEHVAYIERQETIAVDRALQTKNMIKEKDDEHAKNLRRVAEAWADYNAGELRRVAREAERAKSTPVAARVCGDAARDAGLSHAVQKYLDGVRAATERARTGVAQLLERAQRQTETLINLQDTAQRLRLINAPATP